MRTDIIIYLLMSGVSITISSSEMSRAMADLDRYDAAKQKQIKQAVGESTYHVEGRAKTHHPWKTRTGRLISSINNVLKNRGFTGLVAARTNYAVHLEYGTKNMKRKYSFMEPALAYEEPKFLKRLQQILNKVK